MPTSSRCLSVNNINQNLVAMGDVIRGPLDVRAKEIDKELKEGKSMPFTNVIRANIGDSQAMGQKPMTYCRQMIALCFDTSLFKNSEIPEDIKDRAKIILDQCEGHSAGSHTEHEGLPIIRQQVSDFISARDGFECKWENILLSSGASSAIRSILSLLNCEINGKLPGILIPIPQYPIYSATLGEYGITQIGYYLDESTNWSLNINELKELVKDAHKKCIPRAIVIINPGNPTGQILSRENIEKIIKFAHEENLVLLADEVYQQNVHFEHTKFYSFKKVLMEMGPPYNSMPLVSFMSTSKGYLGECGIRGGFTELLNFSHEIKAMLIKSLTAFEWTIAGQIAVSALVNPPKKGEISYDLYVQERDTILKEQAQKAALVYETFNSIEGIKCNPVQGALYAFPQIMIPPKAIEVAKARNLEPDQFYALELLNEAGIVFVAGSEFKQKPGTYHIRTTILPQMDTFKIMLHRFKMFHASFMNKYK